MFSQTVRKQRSQQERGVGEIQVLKFNKVGQRLKRVNCQTGEPM